jgi:signal transduction histidine kinase
MKASAEQAERLHTFAHDLRNRLAGIQQVLQQLGPHPGDDGQRELLEFAERQYFSAMRTVEDLLDDLAVERGTTVLRTEDIALAPLLRQCADDMAHRFGRKHQTLVSHCPEHLSVRGDARVLRDLLGALLSNASKFSHAGGTIRMEASEVPSGLRVDVTDTGVGLSAADLGKLFTRYAWLESRSTAGEAQGRSTLARARQWARQHGGDLVAKSEGPGKGTVFSLLLPR